MSEFLKPLSDKALNPNKYDRPVPDENILKRLKEKEQNRQKQEEDLKALSHLTTLLSESVQPVADVCRRLSMIVELEALLHKLLDWGIVVPGDPLEEKIARRIASLEDNDEVISVYEAAMQDAESELPGLEGDESVPEHLLGDVEDKEHVLSGSSDTHFGLQNNTSGDSLESYALSSSSTEEILARSGLGAFCKPPDPSDQENLGVVSVNVGISGFHGHKAALDLNPFPALGTYFSKAEEKLREDCSEMLSSVGMSMFTRFRLMSLVSLNQCTQSEQNITTEDLISTWNAVTKLRELFEGYASVHTTQACVDLKAMADSLREEIDDHFRFLKPVPQKIFSFLTEEEAPDDPEFVDYEGSEIKEHIPKSTQGHEEGGDGALLQNNQGRWGGTHRLPKSVLGDQEMFFNYFKNIKTDFTPEEEVDIFHEAGKLTKMKVKKVTHYYMAKASPFLRRLKGEKPYDCIRQMTYEESKFQELASRAARARKAKPQFDPISGACNLLATPRSTGLRAREPKATDEECIELLSNMCKLQMNTFLARLRCTARPSDDWLDIDALYSAVQSQLRDSLIGNPDFAATAKIICFFVDEFVLMCVKMFVANSCNVPRTACRSNRRGICLPPPFEDDGCSL